LLSIAVLRRIGAHSGLKRAGAMPEGVGHGRAREESRDSNGALTRVSADFARATIRHGPFVGFDEPDLRKPVTGMKAMSIA